MSGLAVASAARAGAAELVVASRTRQRAERLAARLAAGPPTCPVLSTSSLRLTWS